VRLFWYTDLDPETERITEAALKKLSRAGVELIEGDLPQLPHLIALTTDLVQNHDVKAALTRYLAKYQTGVSFDTLLAKASPDVRQMIETALPGGSDFVPEAQYRAAITSPARVFKRLYFRQPYCPPRKSVRRTWKLRSEDGRCRLIRQ
jgi:Asp-tRNA(Asn)/Glu-tRNA(Gln) amidotransferase A subunit family amidase